jgi:hypothetical protein
MNPGHQNFHHYNADFAHQRLAGLASWAAFSARWRARQGLPLLHPMDVQYLTPQDFRNAHGQPLPPTEQRRLFRAYVQAALQVGAGAPINGGALRPGLLAADLAFVRAAGFQRVLGVRQDFVYGGREDVRPYEAEALLPTRPYGIPTTSETFPAYWLDGSCLVDEDY